MNFKVKINLTFLDSHIIPIKRSPLGEVINTIYIHPNYSFANSN